MNILINNSKETTKRNSQLLQQLLYKTCLSAFKISKLFNSKDKVLNSLKSYVIYLFECASCKARYIGETNRHLQTRINEHLQGDTNSQIFKHLKTSDNCRNLCNSTLLNILDTGSNKYQVQLKEGYYILHNKPELKKQQDHVVLNLSL